MTLLEIAVQDVAGALVAVDGGADRLELCVALAETGGLTPSIGLLDAVLAAVPPHVGVHVLVRPRPGGFVFSRHELDVQMRDVRASVAAGAAGVVVGALTPAGGVDRAAIDAMIAAAGDCEVTFHRALDAVVYLEPAIDDLVELGIVRVLTSGGAARSIDGVDRLRLTVRLAAGRLQVMAGAVCDRRTSRRSSAWGCPPCTCPPAGRWPFLAARVEGPACSTTTDPDLVAAAAAALGRTAPGYRRHCRSRFRWPARLSSRRRCATASVTDLRWWSQGDSNP